MQGKNASVKIAEQQCAQGLRTSTQPLRNRFSLSVAKGNFVSMASETKSRKALQKQREVARDLYINKLWLQKEVAEFLEVTENTITAWKRKDEGTEADWDKRREAIVADPIKLKAAILAEMVSITQGNEPKLNADGLYKLFKMYEGVSDRITPGITAAIMKMYDDFLLTENKELAAANLPYNKKFILHIINTYG